MAFFISSSPHVRTPRHTSEVMIILVLCLLPGIAAQTYFFGYGVIIQILLAIILAGLYETLVMLFRQRPVLSALQDNSALVTAVLIAISIPPLSPWWLTAIGVFFAIVVGKHLYGGLGQNIFNPAMVAYVVLLVSFPVQMTSWIIPETMPHVYFSFADCFSLIFSGFNLDGLSLQQVRFNAIDGVTMATPLDTFKTELRSGYTASEIIQSSAFPYMAASGWKWVNLAYLLGGIVLIQQRIIQWYIPVALLVTLLVLSLLSLIFSPGTIASPSLYLLSGATMLAAFFIATDPVTASTTVKGRLVYGALIGLLIFIIRAWGTFPDGVAFAVLLANLCVPLIDYYTQPRTYGH